MAGEMHGRERQDLIIFFKLIVYVILLVVYYKSEMAFDALTS